MLFGAGDFDILFQNHPTHGYFTENYCHDLCPHSRGHFQVKYGVEDELSRNDTQEFVEHGFFNCHTFTC